MKLRFFLSASMVLLAGATVLAAERSTVACSLKAEQSVQTREIVNIDWSGAGTPMLVIRSKEENSLWWVQRDAVSDGAGKFTVQAQFGNDKTPSGARFEVAMLVVNPGGDSRLKSGESMKVLPQRTLGQTIEVVVDHNLIRSEQPVSRAMEFTVPASGAAVNRLLNVSARMKDPAAGLPMLLVRSSERNSAWWMQDAMQRGEEGDFTGLARIGNDKTAAGSRFEMMLVTPKEAGGRAIEPGSQLKDLSDFHCSRPITVTLGETK